MCEPIRARPAGPLVRQARWRERSPRPVAALGGLLLSLALGLGVSLHFLQESNRNAASLVAENERRQQLDALARDVLSRRSRHAAAYARLGGAPGKSQDPAGDETSPTRLYLDATDLGRRRVLGRMLDAIGALEGAIAAIESRGSTRPRRPG